MQGLNKSITTGNSFTVDSTSTAFLRADGTTDASTYVPIKSSLIQTGGRKFNKTDNTTITTSSSMLGTIHPSTGSTFSANEIQHFVLYV